GGPVIGVVLDGTGFGLDGNLWGGEFFVGTPRELRRAAHFRYVPLAGGEASVRNPWITAVSFLREAIRDEAWNFLDRLGYVKRFGEQTLKNVMALLGHGEHCPLSSGAGRLFDAVSSIVGVCHVNTFEAEAPMRLEGCIDGSISAEYPYNVFSGDPITIDFSETILTIINDLERGVSAGAISAKFHNTIAGVVRDVAAKLAVATQTSQVILSGGVFQNRYLLSRVIGLLRGEGLRVYVNDLVPCNDACVSLGQAYLVRERIRDL
ncbi:MAG: Kae1-like domain-containing protein, partial [Thermodesulfovibrionales bacterium]